MPTELPAPFTLRVEFADRDPVDVTVDMDTFEVAGLDDVAVFTLATNRYRPSAESAAAAPITVLIHRPVPGADPAQILPGGATGGDLSQGGEAEHVSGRRWCVAAAAPSRPVAGRPAQLARRRVRCSEPLTRP